MSVEGTRKIVNIISMIGILVTLLLVVYCVKLGIFTDMARFQSLIGSSKVAGPILFVLLQIIQVVIPIIPGGISTAAGVMVFGPYLGFIYNYVGIVIGSIIIFLLSRRFGKPFILSLISDKTYEKYSGWLDDGRRFERIFALAIFLPMAPDDALCLIAGLSKMSVKKYVAIIILAKPAAIYCYSMALIYGGTFLTKLLGS